MLLFNPNRMSLKIVFKIIMSNIRIWHRQNINTLNVLKQKLSHIIHRRHSILKKISSSSSNIYLLAYLQTRSSEDSAIKADDSIRISISDFWNLEKYIVRENIEAVMKFLVVMFAFALLHRKYLWDRDYEFF